MRDRASFAYSSRLVEQSEVVADDGELRVAPWRSSGRFRRPFRAAGRPDRSRPRSWNVMPFGVITVRLDRRRRDVCDAAIEPRFRRVDRASRRAPAGLAAAERRERRLEPARELVHEREQTGLAGPFDPFGADDSSGLGILQPRADPNGLASLDDNCRRERDRRRRAPRPAARRPPTGPCRRPA